MLTTALGLSLWVAFGSTVLAVADGLGAHPLRRLVVGVALTVGSLVALWRRGSVSTVLQARPWLVLPLAAAELTIVSVDGIVGGPYVAFTMTSIGVATVVARPRTVWACVVVLDVGYAALVLSDRAPSTLGRAGELGGVVGQLLGYPFAALSLLGLAMVFQRFTDNADGIRDDLRAGAPALTPGLTRALAQAREPLALPAAPMRGAGLTAAEVRVVEGLAAGRVAKELAHDWGISVATVRSHIKRAKRKTGARTLPALAGLVAHPDWPEVPAGGG